MQKLCLFYSQINKIISLYIQHGRHIFLRNSQGAQKYVGSLLNCTVWILIGWDIGLLSHEKNKLQIRKLA